MHTPTWPASPGQMTGPAPPNGGTGPAITGVASLAREPGVTPDAVRAVDAAGRLDGEVDVLHAREVDAHRLGREARGEGARLVAIRTVGVDLEDHVPAEAGLESDLRRAPLAHAADVVRDLGCRVHAEALRVHRRLAGGRVGGVDLQRQVGRVRRVLVRDVLADHAPAVRGADP